MGGFLRGSLALCMLAGCSGGVPPAPESATSVATPPTAAVSPGMMAAVRAATDRSPPDVETVTLPNGERLTRATFRTGHQHVVLGADGMRTEAYPPSASTRRMRRRRF